MIVKLNELDKVAVTELNGSWLEPSRARQDAHPDHLRRDSWVVRDSRSGLYLGTDGAWVANPVDAWTCMWLPNAILYLRQRFGKDSSRLQLELTTFYCKVSTFPRGWFADG